MWFNAPPAMVFMGDTGSLSLGGVIGVTASASRHELVLIIIGGLLMIFLADGVSEFLKKNRMFEVLGLFILFIVGIMLLSEGAYLANMKILGSEVLPMSKTTFYFVIFILILIDIVQSRYQKLINKKKL